MADQQLSLSVAERKLILGALAAAGIQTRASPEPGTIEIFTDSPTEAGFRRWVVFPFTFETFQAMAYEGTVEDRLAEAAYNGLAALPLPVGVVPVFEGSFPAADFAHLFKVA